MPIFAWLGSTNTANKPPVLNHKFTVKLNCEGCCKAVKKTVEACGGVQRVDCDVNSQTVTVSGWMTREEAEEFLKRSGKEVGEYLGSV